MFNLLLFSAKYYIEQRLSMMQDFVNQGKSIEKMGGVLSHLLANKKMSMPDIYGNMTELFLAGVDTVNLTQ